jgi:tetratricopeptide (TPR) repeat protein
MYERALTEFRTVKRLYDQKIESGNIQSNESPVDAKLWNNIGMCEAQLGNLDLSYAAYEESMKLDPSYVEAKINYVIILKESSGCMKARTLLHEVIAMNSSMLRQAYQLLFMIYYSLGMIQSAKETVIKMLEYSTTVADRVYGFHQLALCYQCLGEFSHAALNFTKALKLDKNHYCRVQKEVLLYYWNHIGYSTSTFCIDSDIEPLLKEAWSKSLSTSASIQYTNQKVPDSASNRGIKSIHLKTSTGETHVKTHQLLKISSKLGRWIQINSVGFVRNNRQYRMFGLAVIEMASMLREHCDLLVAGKDGLTVKNAASSCARYNSRKDDFHPFGYRDLFDVIVKWRQISEPNDPVWWIDRLSQTSFEEGFGLHTPMVNGELKCIRYYSYFPKGFALMKNLLLTDFYYSAAGTKKELSNELKQHVLNANTLDDLMSIVDEDFYVVCPCRSALNESILLEGTRLTLVKKQPEGYDFSIRSAGLPSRWAAMDAEMKYAFDRVISSLICSTSGSYTNEQLLLVIRESVSLFFYWVNFAPLSRGTAACGYAALLAVIVATGKRIITPIPPKIQLDWEAIFTSDRNVFIENVLMWLRTDDCEFSLENVNFKESVVNLGDMICLLQY